MGRLKLDYIMKITDVPNVVFREFIPETGAIRVSATSYRNTGMGYNELIGDQGLANSKEGRWS